MPALLKLTDRDAGFGQSPLRRLVFHRRQERSLFKLGTSARWCVLGLCAAFASLPPAWIGQSAEATQSSENNRGLLYKNDWIRAVPISVHVLRIDRSRTDFELVTTLSQNRILGLGPLSEQIRTIPPEYGRALAALNGDFFHVEHEPYGGDPKGLQILMGELASAPSGEPCFWIDAKGNPKLGEVVSQFKVTWPTGESTPFGLNQDRRPYSAVLYTPRLGPTTRTVGGREFILEAADKEPLLPLRVGKTYSARVREVRETGNNRLAGDALILSIGSSLAARLPAVAAGGVVKLSLATTPEITGAQTALGGGPFLVREGKLQSSYEHQSHRRNPRAAFGWNSEYFFFVEVDGRQPGLSMGMTLAELAAYLVKQGCEEALNLDGGGSAQLWLDGRVVSSPCYGYERPTANGLVLVQRKTKPPQ